MFKLAALVAGVLGLVATSAPPAQARTISASVFIANVPLAGPLTFPINPTTAGLPQLDPTTAPTLADKLTSSDCGGHGPLPLPAGLHPVEELIQLLPQFRQCHPNYGGHTRAIGSPTPLLCVNVGANTNKLAKAPVHAGACSFTGATGKAPEGNHVHGFCGLSGGQLQVRFIDGAGQVFTIDIHFEGYASFLFLLGHWTKLTNTSQTGLFYGAVLAVPLPITPPVPPTNSCASNTATVFTVIGGAAFLPHPIA